MQAMLRITKRAPQRSHIDTNRRECIGYGQSEGCPSTIDLMTVRNVEQRRRESNTHSDEELAELRSAPEDASRQAEHEEVRQAVRTLEPEQRVLIEAYYFEGKTFAEIAVEHNLPKTTVQYRHQRALARLRVMLKALTAAVVVFFTKEVRAQGARLALYMARALPQATCALAVTVTCAVLVPAEPMASGLSPQGTIAKPLMLPASTGAENMPPVTPASFSEVTPVKQEVAPVKQNRVDMPALPWSVPVMKSTTMTRSLQQTVFPLVLAFTPWTTPAGCAGSTQQQPIEEAEHEYEDGETDPYEMVCANERRRGEECLTKEAWCAKMGKRPARIGCE